jgi:hypothetical protein
MKRPIDRGLLAAVKRELAFIVPASATRLLCEVTVGPRSATSKYVDAHGHVRWRNLDGRELEVRVVGSDGGDGDPYNVALAYLLGRAEKVKPGAGVPVVADTLHVKSAAKKTVKKAPSKKKSTKKNSAKKNSAKKNSAKKKTSRRRP